MTDVSTFRLYLMRALYLLICVGLGMQIWPAIIHHDHPVSVMHSVARSLLAALTIMAALGVRYPLQMLPLLLFELLWKTIWLAVIALPAWMAGALDADTHETAFACLMGLVLCPIVIPWRYTWANYVRKRGDRWHAVARPTT